MKTRSDFVSNSSSSSFILKDAGFFAYFGITKQDIDDALTDLCGGREAFTKRLSDEITKCEEALAKAKIEAGLSITTNDSLEFDIKYQSDRLRELKTKGLGLWCIYDMTDKKDRQACFRGWDKHFASWFAPEEGEYETWDKFEEMLRWKCDFDNVWEVVNGEDKTLRESKYNRKTDKHIHRAVPGGAEFIKRVRKNLGVKTMKEVLHSNDCTLMIHFGDNDVYEVNGMTEPGRADEKEYNSEEENEKIRNSKYESESYSAKRFFEILIGYFVEKGKVNLSDPGLLDYWKIDDKDSWYKKNHPGKKYYLDGAAATWQDVYDDMLKCNAIMHEG